MWGPSQISRGMPDYRVLFLAVSWMRSDWKGLRWHAAADCSTLWVRLARTSDQWRRGWRGSSCSNVNDMKEHGTDDISQTAWFPLHPVSKSRPSLSLNWAVVCWMGCKLLLTQLTAHVLLTYLWGIVTAGVCEWSQPQSISHIVDVSCIKMVLALSKSCKQWLRLDRQLV